MKVQKVLNKNYRMVCDNCIRSQAHMYLLIAHRTSNFLTLCVYCLHATKNYLGKREYNIEHGSFPGKHNA